MPHFRLHADRGILAQGPSVLRGALVLLTLSVTGCQAFAPAAIGSLTASKDEKKIQRQAAVDPFPSPEDVGLAKASASSAESTKRR